MINIETHRELYNGTVESVEKALTFAKSLSVPSEEGHNFHFYWRVPRPFSRKQILPVKSCLATQNKPIVNLWSNVDLSTEPLLKDIAHLVNFRIYDLKEESKGTILESISGALDDDKCYLGGDLFRILILHKYGGVYGDMDLVFLRDIGPLMPHEFMYQWGSSGTNSSEASISANGAIMRLFANSTLSNDLMKQLKAEPGNPDSTCWGTDLYRKVRQYNKNWIIFPCAFFNSEWGLSRTPDPFFAKDNIELYDGAFAWHWHNQWDEPIQKGCKFEVLEQITDRKFKEKYE